MSKYSNIIAAVILAVAIVYGAYLISESIDSVSSTLWTKLK